MPRTAENSTSLASDIAARLTHLVEVARSEGRDAALADIRQIIAGGTPAERGPGRPKGSKNKPKAPAKTARKSGKKRTNPWAGLSAEDRLARVNAIRKGRGLAPKDKL